MKKELQDLGSLIEQYKKEELKHCDEPFHHEAEIASGLKFFLEWYKQKKEKSNETRTPFIITIDDEFCKWEYGFDGPNIDNISIKDITDVLCQKFDCKEKYSKLIETHC